MTGFAEYDRYDALGLADLIRRRQVTPLELLEEAIARRNRLNPFINAIVLEMDREARQTLQNGIPDGPFAGVPFLIKDLHATLEGTTTSHGNKLWRKTTEDRKSVV